MSDYLQRLADVGLADALSALNAENVWCAVEDTGGGTLVLFCYREDGCKLGITNESDQRFGDAFLVMEYDADGNEVRVFGEPVSIAWLAQGAKIFRAASGNAMAKSNPTANEPEPSPTPPSGEERVSVELRLILGMWRDAEREAATARALVQCLYDAAHGDPDAMESALDRAAEFLDEGCDNEPVPARNGADFDDAEGDDLYPRG